MASERDLAAVLLEKARGDASALEALADREDVPNAVVGFHAQQAVEKLLKAVLARHAIEYPYSHDLERLAELVGEADVAEPPELARATELTPWALEFRYEDPTTEQPFDRRAAAELVRALLDWAADAVE